MRRLPRRVLVAVLVATAACFSEKPSPTASSGEVAATVEMTPQLQFSPSVVTIKAGQAVRWKNAATFVHTATGDPALAQSASDAELPAGAQPFNSGELTAGATYEHVFTVPGEYKYFCIPHESFGMVGTVIVTPE